MAENGQRSSNRLADQTSAYLLQHAENPVNWYPWCDEALNESQQTDRPLFVSIGYSACHWCHVMERESFEDPATAAWLNEHFVCIKVDREERPDLDQIYMEIVTQLTGHGGWPLHVFCQPDGRPFYGGTYWPPSPRPGQPSFRQVLTQITDAWKTRRDEIDAASEQLVAALDLSLDADEERRLDQQAIVETARAFMSQADLTHGGFGSAPKFPTPSQLEFLLSALDFLETEEADKVATHLDFTGREMARRGLYDHLAGGFHRYCVDTAWTLPHFEKMLYDQGLLLRFYSELLRRGAAKDECEWPLRETAELLRREMKSPEGGFYASQDAEAEGIEGAYQVWTPEQIESALGPQAAGFCEAYSVHADGNFEGGTTHLVDATRGPREDWEAERHQLLEVRQRRTAPATDRKRICSWNAYAISGLARAASALSDDRLLAEASAAFLFIEEEMIDDDGRLHRIFEMGRRSVPAFLDDHAALLEASLDLHRAGADDHVLWVALHLAQQIGDRFIDPDTGAIFYTAHDGDRLIHRPRSDRDGATPAAAGLTALALDRLAQLSGLKVLSRQVDGILRTEKPGLDRAPQAFPTMMRAVGLRLRGISVAVIVGEPEDPRTQALATRAREVLLPEDAVVIHPPGRPTPTGIASSWLEGRSALDGRPTAYVCHGSQCSLPALTPAEIQFPS